MMRTVLLRLSRSKSLERWIKKRQFARKAVARFMPGEELEDALEAAARLGRRGIGVVLTELGENVTEEAHARDVTADYAEVLCQLDTHGLAGEISVKATHLGLDLGEELARENLARLVDEAERRNSMVWVDMEDSSYVDRTLALVRAARNGSDRIGVCLQAYLHRTPEDLERLMDPPTRVRLVKGAYREPPEVALPKRIDVDRRFHDLAVRMLGDPEYRSRAVPVFGTHDDRLIERIRDSARQSGVPAAQLEFHMLYGIRTDLQERLNAAGAEVRVLISYGAHWYPWYLRRLAERPANLWFVVKQLFRR
jgi:proline dehydrogenase